MTDLSGMSDADLIAAIQARMQPAADGPAKLSGFEGGLRQFAHGASFGFDDELAGLASQLTGGDYQSAKDAYKSEREAWREANPGASLAANVAGGAASSIGLGGAAAATRLGRVAGGALQTLPKWGQYATLGGAAGAVQGAGDAEGGALDRLQGAAEGGALGAVTGAVLPPVVRGAAKLVDSTAGNAARHLINALRTPEQQGVRRLSNALARDEITPQALADRLRELGPQATIADAGGQNVLGLADTAALMPGKAKNAGMNALEERAKGAGSRVMGGLLRSMGLKDANTDAAVMQLHENMRQVAKDAGYDRILDTGAADVTGNLDEILQTPTVRGALGGAYRMIADEAPFNAAAKPTLSYFDVDPATGAVNGLTQKPSLRALDYVKRQLDAVISDGTDPITGKLTSEAVRALKLKNGLLGAMDNINPEYAGVRKLYATEKAGEGALRMGRAFLADDAEVTARHVADMSEAERQYFKLGAARAVRDKILGAPDTGMAYEQFMNRPAVREKLQAAFGDDAAFQGFMKDLAGEVRMGKTFAALRGNSKTAARLAGAQDAGAPLAGGEIPLTKEGWARKLAIWATQPSEEVAGQLNDILLTSDPQRLAQVLQSLRNVQPSLNRPLLTPSPQAKQAAALLLGQQSAQAGR